MRYRDLIIIVRISYDTRQVGAYEISSIYYLKINKKALDHVSKTLLVELVGTAPTSAGLSLLVVYRLVSFYGLKQRLYK